MWFSPMKFSKFNAIQTNKTTVMNYLICQLSICSLHVLLFQALVPREFACTVTVWYQTCLEVCQLFGIFILLPFRRFLVIFLCGVFVFKWQPYRDWVVAKKEFCGVWTQHNIGNDTLSFIEAHVTWMFQIIILTPLCLLPFPISHEIRYDHILYISKLTKYQ